MLIITNIVMVRHYEIISDTFHLVGICTDGNYTRTNINKLYNY